MFVHINVQLAHKANNVTHAPTIFAWVKKHNFVFQFKTGLNITLCKSVLRKMISLCPISLVIKPNLLHGENFILSPFWGKSLTWLTDVGRSLHNADSGASFWRLGKVSTKAYQGHFFKHLASALALGWWISAIIRPRTKCLAPVHGFVLHILEKKSINQSSQPQTGEAKQMWN